MFVVALLVGLVALGGVRGAPPPPVTFEAVHELFHVVPIEKILRVATEYLAYDREVQDFVGYLHSAQFKDLVRAVDSQPEYIQFLNLLEGTGFEAYKYVNVIHTLLGMPGLDNPNKSDTPTPALTGGVAGMIGDIRGLVNEKQATMFYQDMLKTNPSFKSLVDKFMGQEFKTMLEKLVTKPEFTNLLDQLGLSPDQ